MKIFLHTCLILLTVLLQITLFSYLNIYRASFSLILVIAILLIFTKRREFAFYWAALGGFLLDALSGIPFGINTITLLLSIAILDFLVRRYLAEVTVLVIGLSILLLTIFAQAIFGIILHFEGYQFIFNNHIYSILISSAYNTFLGILILLAFVINRKRSRISLK